MCTIDREALVISEIESLKDLEAGNGMSTLKGKDWESLSVSHYSRIESETKRLFSLRTTLKTRI